MERVMMLTMQVVVVAVVYDDEGDEGIVEWCCVTVGRVVVGVVLKCGKLSFRNFSKRNVSRNYQLTFLNVHRDLNLQLRPSSLWHLSAMSAHQTRQQRRAFNLQNRLRYHSSARQQQTRCRLDRQRIFRQQQQLIEMRGEFMRIQTELASMRHYIEELFDQRSNGEKAAKSSKKSWNQLII